MSRPILHTRPGTIVAKNVTAKICGDPDPNREARSQAALERIGGRTYEGWHKGLKTSGGKGG